MDDPSMETPVTLRQAYLIMFDFLESEWEKSGHPDELGALLGSLSLWNEPNGQGVPMDAAIFPQWIDCARRVLQRDQSSVGYTNADVKLLPKSSED
ncbi:hypothetical protein UC34_16265 [Pandoraea vervacti]|uniref:Uncharacterized protein n=1 Tax=Pandoraea vervacti TaxID=656178 RepID=A0ABN4FY84_9BURK|nr:hypothetical protein [Pandoraea vervacti]AJP58103.1 hypothetical protein UC34_16265 [Pandoraea vervacti]